MSDCGSSIISIHDLTRRSTKLPSDNGNKNVFQLATSRGGRFQIPPKSPSITTFQLTTSRGGRRADFEYNVILFVISTHDLTRRSTCNLCGMNNVEIFQLTTSRGGRRLRHTYHTMMAKNFNSRPHEEVDDGTEGKPRLKEAFQLTTSRGGRQLNNQQCPAD